MARKYYGTFKSFNNTDWKVEIHDAPTGSATAGSELKLAGEGFRLERDGEGSKWHENRVKSSRVTARWVIPNSTVLDAFLAIQTQSETYWTMVVWRGSELWFVGRVLADQLNRLRESLDGKPVIELTAVDGLDLLDGYNVQPSWFTSDFIQINVLIKECLEELNLSAYWAYLGKTDYYFFDAQSMYAADASRKGVDMLRLNVRTFLQTYDPFQDIKWIDLAGLYDELNMVTCKQAIEQVCEIFNIRFMHANGGYWITDVTSYAGTTIPYRRYDSSMVYKTTGTYSHRQALGTLPARPQWAAKPNLYYQPASRQCIIDTERLNIAYASRYRGNASINAYELIATEIPTGSSPNIVPFKFKILVRFAYPANSTKNYEQAEIIHRTWLEDSSGNKKQLDANGYWVSTSFVDSTNEKIDIKNQQGNWITYKFEKQCTTAPVGFDKLRIIIDEVNVIAPLFSKIGGWRTGGTTRDDVAFWANIDVAFATTSDYQNPDYVFKVTELFNASASNLANSTEIELQPRYYYSGNKYGVGNIWANDGTQWVIADEFFGGWDSITKGTPTKMLGVGLSSLYANFMPVVRGTWIDSGSLDLVKSLYFDNYTWVLNGVSFNPRQDQWEGEWLGVAPVYTNTTTTGEGLRIGNTQDGIVRDRLNLIETQINNYQSMLSDMPDTILGYLVNEADGAPTAQPTQNIIWETQLRYDDSTEQVVWHLQEHGAPISYTVGTHTLTNGYELVICNSQDGNVVVNLPDADESRGKKYIFIKTNNNHTVTIDAGTFLINDGTSTTLGSKYESKTVMSDGAKWFIVAKV
jgi:hypothetical protein